MGSPFSLSQLLDARCQAEKTLDPAQMVFLANVAEDTGENTEAAPGIQLSESEITRAEEVPAMILDNDLSEESNATRVNNLENTLHNERLLSERLRARNEELEALVRQQSETLNTLKAVEQNDA